MFTRKYENQLFAVIRIIAGFLFLWHGAQKLFGYPPLPTGVLMPWQTIWIGGIVEFFGGSLIMLGLWTRCAAFAASGEMAYAYWTSHGPRTLLPLVNHGELAILYCFLFLYFSAHGSGIWSLDHLIKPKNDDKTY
jgi:putative oxidoreductase